jgi:glycerol-3-phosphate acyltransferase PlsY
MPFAVLLIFTYLSGALPWSVWLSRLFLGADPRSQADGNPGAANAFRIGGWRLGVSVLLLDFFKAFIPVFVGRWGLQLSDSQMFWLGLMPTVGHAFSIFLRLRGGRAIVTLFGVWSGVTLYALPMVMGGTAIAVSLLIKNSQLRALAVPLSVIAYVLFTEAPLWMLALGTAQLAILISKLGAFYLSSGSLADTPAGLKL